MCNLPLPITDGASQQANLIAPRTLDLTSVKLTLDAAFALSDALAVDWGLRKLILRDCDLDELVRFDLSPLTNVSSTDLQLPNCT